MPGIFSSVLFTFLHKVINEVKPRDFPFPLLNCLNIFLINYLYGFLAKLNRGYSKIIQSSVSVRQLYDTTLPNT